MGRLPCPETGQPLVTQGTLWAIAEAMQTRGHSPERPNTGWRGTSDLQEAGRGLEAERHENRGSQRWESFRVRHLRSLGDGARPPSPGAGAPSLCKMHPWRSCSRCSTLALHAASPWPQLGDRGRTCRVQAHHGLWLKSDIRSGF